MKFTAASFGVYAKMPEMRQFWIVSVLLIGLLVAGMVYFPAFLRLPMAGVFLAVLAVTYFNGIKTAKANFQMRLEKHLLKTVIESLHDAVVAYDTEFKILEFNAAAEKIFNLHAKDIIGKTITLEESTKQAHLRLLSQILFPSLAPMLVQRSEPGAETQVVDLIFDNPYLELRVITAHVLDNDNTVTGFIKVIRDRTREVQLLKSKNEFITVASHQLRTPLTAINWAFQESLKGDLAEQERHTLLDTGAKAAAKLSKIVEDFLNIAKIEEGRFGFTFEEQDLLGFIEKVVAEAALVAKQYHVNVYFDRPKEAIRAPFDASKIGMALANLIDNAIKYNVDGGQVRVWVSRVPNIPFVEITVEDTGIGIPPEDIDKLFTKFYRGSSQMKMETEGSGLGLYLVKNIVEQHGGQVWAESTMGRGTKVFFTLPTDLEYIPKKEATKSDDF